VSGSTPKMAERFLQAYGLGRLLDDARFATNQARVQHADALDEEIAQAIAARTLAENLRIIEANALTAVAVQTVADIEQDPHWHARQLLLDVPIPNGNGHNGEAIRMHNVVPRLSETPGEVSWPGGELGQHNREVYGTELGLTCDDIARLQQAGVV
jgi:crotonobetainyl-CoA:carnitine CoA-transferase CaiB-like acyl-CoA transferase